MNPNEIMEKLGLTYSDLTKDEREAYVNMLDAQAKKVLTVSDITEYIARCLESVEDELTRMDHNSIKDILLKARLRNYRLLYAMLTSSERAQKLLEQADKGIGITK